MALKKYDDLNDMQIDALREIGNIGSGNAATSLADMLSKPVDIGVPKIEILDYDDVVKSLGGPEQLLVGILLSLTGDVQGMMMFLLQKDFVKMLVENLIGEPFDEEKGLDEMSLSAIQEVGNIMAASYVNAIASMTGLDINISVPSLSVDMAGAILSTPAIYYANISDKIIFIQDEFNQTNKENEVTSHILLIPEVDSLQKIMECLGLGESFT
ncbi:MAG: chemotaxis protein CheC [Faecalibacterium sp.]|jgi:chemotaxis protein CheC|nr:chemotaxis protein CheC [Faecalibacterium sp.]